MVRELVFCLPKTPAKINMLPIIPALIPDVVRPVKTMYSQIKIIEKEAEYFRPIFKNIKKLIKIALKIITWTPEIAVKNRSPEAFNWSRNSCVIFLLLPKIIPSKSKL